MDPIILFEALYLLCFILTLVTFIRKSVLYFSYPKYKRRARNWFYFDRYERSNSNNDKSLQFKNKQNRLTTQLVVFALLGLIFLGVAALLS